MAFLLDALLLWLVTIIWIELSSYTTLPADFPRAEVERQIMRAWRQYSIYIVDDSKSMLGIFASDLSMLLANLSEGAFTPGESLERLKRCVG